MQSGQVFLNLPVDALVNLFVRTVDIHRIFMVNYFFEYKSRDVETHDMGLGDEIAVGCHKVIDVEVVGPADAIEAPVDLVFQAVLIRGFHQFVFNEFHGDGVCQGIDAVLDRVEGTSSGILFGGFDFGQDAGFSRTGSEDFSHGFSFMLIPAGMTAVN
jgi:hypothetical protein